jgi:hypothetical protein
MNLIQPVLTTDQQIELSRYINIYRTRNQAPPIVWDNKIANFAQKWSYHLDASNIFVHSNTPLYGENLSYFQGYGKDPMTLLKKAIDGWYNEIGLYDFNNPGFSEATGHFTCLVWVSSTAFGMGITINPITSAAIIVFNSSPPSNYIGQFKQNVLPTIGSVPVPKIAPPPDTPKPKPTPVLTGPTKQEQIINLLNHLIHQLKSHQKSNITITTINNILQIMQTIPLPNETILDELFYVYYLLQTHQNPNNVLEFVYTILNNVLTYNAMS